MPTNALRPARTADLAERVLEENPDLRFILGVSIDGLSQTHDAMRGVPGAFETAFETIRVVNQRRAAHAAPERGDWDRRLAIAVITCLTERNIDEYPRLVEHIRANADVDMTLFEPLRDVKKDSALGPPPVAKFRDAVARTLRTNRELMAKRRPPEEVTTRLSYVQQLHAVQAAYLETGRIALRCMAGRRVAAVDHDGQLRLCELLEPVANLREMGLDFRAGWNCRKAVAQRKWIERTRCACGHCVIIGHSLDDDAAVRAARQAAEARLCEGDSSV